jgi:hypothetical protein
MSSPKRRAIERVAEQAVQEALSGALEKIMLNAAVLHPTGSSTTTVQIYLKAIGAYLKARGVSAWVTRA